MSNSGKRWKDASTSHPCPICGKPDWCRTTSDGTVVACRRVEVGCFKSKLDRSGCPLYLHRLAWDSDHGSQHPNRPSSEMKRANSDLLHKVYSELLAALALSEAHRDDLRQRGLPDDEIDRRCYRTLPIRNRPRLARDLRERFRDDLLKVPGFVMKTKDGAPYVTIAGSAGLLIPVRDHEGRIVALKVRRGDAENGPRYLYISSKGHAGPGPGASVHVPIGVEAPVDTVRITEGELKADAVTVLSRVATISAPGVTSWRPCLEVARNLGAETTRLAFDMDARTKPPVARALARCAKALRREGFGLELETWSLAAGKGIDDLLASGGSTVVLADDDAMEAIRETAGAAGITDDDPEEALDRLYEVIASGGAAGLFEDKALLEALARTSVEDRARFAGIRASIREQVSVRDLDKALKPLVRDLARERPTLSDTMDIYRVADGHIVRQRLTSDGPVDVPLCNFEARITEQLTHDDGVEQTTYLGLEGSLAEGHELPSVQVSAEEFCRMDWPLKRWGTHAVVYAGLGTKDHLRTALQVLSCDVQPKTIYAHSGWREVEAQWCYLHADGAIGGDGPLVGIDVSLPEALERFALPDPPSGQPLIDAVRASLRLAEVGPDRISYPLLISIYRAVLGDCDFSLHLAGPTGAFKTELATLCQQHFGSAMDARHLPASWSSTGNALEGLAFAAKDALLVVDDFAPTGSTGDVQRYHRDADRLFRAQGNRSGRQRMRADASLRCAKPPRGVILSTGEDVPRGQSCRARVLLLEVSPGDVDRLVLTHTQRDGADGRYAESLSGFVRWLAPQYESAHQQLGQEISLLREQATRENQHARTPDITANLAVGLRYFLNFAQEVGAIGDMEADQLWQRGWQALIEAAASQASHQEATEPTARFVRLLIAAVVSGRVHIAGADGGPPTETAERWGWRRVIAGHAGEWQSQGRRIGWIDGRDLFVEPDAAYAETQALATQQGEGLAVGQRTLHKRLKEKGLLRSTDESRQRITVRRSLEGTRREVLHLDADHLAQKSVPIVPTVPPTSESR